MAKATLSYSKERLPFIDATKGILIVFLVFHHVVNIARGKMSVENMEFLTKWDVLYAPYFMQTFFFITGYCSSYNKAFKSFLARNTKALLVPLISFSVINQLVEWGMFGESFLWCSVLGKDIFFLAELYWFLCALFIAKMLMYGILRINENVAIQFGIVVIVFLFAVSLNGKHFHAYNWFHWHNGFVDLLFLYIGYTFRKYDILRKYCLNNYFLFLYVASVVAFEALGKSVPYYTHFPHFTWKYAIPFAYFSMVGSIMILNVGRVMANCSKLNFLGRNTLVVYGIHFSVLGIMVFLLSRVFIPSNHIEGICFYFLVGGATLLVCYYLCLLFLKKPLSYLIGKF